jgi:methylenetetrahydrofolate reductase (NADPH)
MSHLVKKINDAIQMHGVGYSIEIFPPKTNEGLTNLKKTLKNICLTFPNRPPTYIDVTYCAGGTGAGKDVQRERDATLSLCDWIQSELQIPTCAHLAANGLSLAEIDTFINEAKSKNITNLMALRGDAESANTSPAFAHASDLVTYLRQKNKDLNIIVAAYPEGHPDCHEDLDADLKHLQYKVNCGADMVITQLFLDPSIYLSFCQQISQQGGLHSSHSDITPPIIPGIILFSTITGMWRMVKLAGDCITIPLSVIDEAVNLEKTNDKNAIRQWGLRLACHLCEQLYKNGVRFFHIYSLNAGEATCRLIQHIIDLPRRFES